MDEPTLLGKNGTYNYVCYKNPKMFEPDLVFKIPDWCKYTPPLDIAQQFYEQVYPVKRDG
jgi:hypothetical protein